jgi:CheY-like chemotaxis protein
MNDSIGRHSVDTSPRVLVVDGSKVVRRLIGQVLQAEVPGVEVIGCASGAEAERALQQGVVDFVTISLRLPDMDGLELARYIREYVDQTYVPVVVVSGDVDERLRARTLGADVTDYFDKSLGFAALGAFIRGYIRPEDAAEGRVLYVEDSRVVALATRRMLEKYGLTVEHVTSVEDAVAVIDRDLDNGEPGPDVILTDVTLKGELTGGDLLRYVREDRGLGKGRMPALVMTGDDNPEKQSQLIRAGANDLVEKPVDERLLITKLLFQLRVGRHLRGRDAPAHG